MPTIDEAIELLEQEAVDNQHEGDMVLVDAIRLGIEALKFCNNFRKNSLAWGYKPLPGETEEAHDDNTIRD